MGGDGQGNSSGGGGLTVAERDADQNFDNSKAGDTSKPCGQSSVTASQSKIQKTFIQIELVDEEGNPVAGESYEISLPDGSVVDGSLDDKGQARIEGIDPGSCQITFPDLDKDVWSSK
jgi:hypothetical protein